MPHLPPLREKQDTLAINFGPAREVLELIKLSRAGELSDETRIDIDVCELDELCSGAELLSPKVRAEWRGCKFARLPGWEGRSESETWHAAMGMHFFISMGSKKLADADAGSQASAFRATILPSRTSSRTRPPRSTSSSPDWLCHWTMASRDKS